MIQRSHKEKDKIIHDLVLAAKEADLGFNELARVVGCKVTEFPVFINLMNAINNAEKEE